MHNPRTRPQLTPDGEGVAAGHSPRRTPATSASASGIFRPAHCCCIAGTAPSGLDPRDRALQEARPLIFDRQVPSGHYRRLRSRRLRIVLPLFLLSQALCNEKMELINSVRTMSNDCALRATARDSLGPIGDRRFVDTKP